MLHGIWHLERSMLFTLKEMLFRPGYVARNYISGRRVRYYSFFTLLVWIIALNIFISHQITIASPPETPETDPFFLFLEHNSKPIIFSLLPVMRLMHFWGIQASEI